MIFRRTHVREVSETGKVHWRKLRLGEGGELYVHALLSHLGEEYKILDNVVLLGDSGNTTQIDHVVVSRFGVFVIETKDYSGKIYGSEKSQYWTQYVGSEQHKMYNPIMQNNGHARALKLAFYDLPSIPIVPIVVFVGSADLNLTIEHYHVVQGFQLQRTIKAYQTGHVVQESVQRYIDAIHRAESRVTDDQRAMHAQNIHHRIASKEFIMQSGCCPRCGRKLVLRQGKSGPFWGCSGYPSCRFTAQYDRQNPSEPKLG